MEQQLWIAKRQADVAQVCGVSLDTVKSWAKQGMPGSPGAYSLAEIIPWLRTKGPWKQHSKAETDDPLLADGGDSPGLERYRLAKAALAELELEERKGSLLSREKVRTALLRWATVLRRMGEVLVKRFGNDASGIVNNALGQCQSVIDYEFSSSEPSDDGASGGAFAGFVTVESADSADDEPVGGG